LFFLLVGGAAFLLSQEYEIGSATSMGAGYFPALLGGVLMIVGGALITKALRSAETEKEPIQARSVQPLIFILIGVVLFALLIERAGLIVAILALIASACFKRALTNPAEVLSVFAILAAFSTIVFVYGFGMSMPLWWFH
jgi:hypothetical protein